MSRSASAQGEPPADLSEFPLTSVAGGEVFYRSTKAPNGFGWFSSTGEGRFDLASPRGTLYVGRSAHCAVMERVAAPRPAEVDSRGRTRNLGSLIQDGRVAEEEADQILVWTLTVDKPFSVANLTDARAGTHFAVTNELSAGAGSYDVAHRWAASFDAHCFGGIEYRSRFVTKAGAGEHALAVFGQEKIGVGPFDEAATARTLTEAAADAQILIRRKPAALTNVTDTI